MMPIFFLIFIFLGIYIFQLDGALDGYKYIFSLDINKMFHPTVWIYALGQAFFSLSIGGSGTVVYGSYLSDAESIPISAKLTSIFDTVAAMLAAFVIISAMATTGSQLSTGGPGLMFIFLPNIFKNMPAGGLISIVFFMAVLFAGLTSLINLFETPIEALQQKFHFSRKKAVSTIAALGVIVGVSIEGVVGGWMDICSIYISPIGAILAAISFFWVCTPDFIMANVNLGNENKMGKWIVPAGKYGFCGLSILVLIFGAVMGGIG